MSTITVLKSRRTRRIPTKSAVVWSKRNTHAPELGVIIEHVRTRYHVLYTINDHDLETKKRTHILKTTLVFWSRSLNFMVQSDRWTSGWPSTLPRSARSSIILLKRHDLWVLSKHIVQFPSLLFCNANAQFASWSGPDKKTNGSQKAIKSCRFSELMGLYKTIGLLLKY